MTDRSQCFCLAAVLAAASGRSVEITRMLNKEQLEELRALYLHVKGRRAAIPMVDPAGDRGVVEAACQNHLLTQLWWLAGVEVPIRFIDIDHWNAWLHVQEVRYGHQVAVSSEVALVA